MWIIIIKLSYYQLWSSLSKEQYFVVAMASSCLGLEHKLLIWKCVSAWELCRVKSFILFFLSLWLIKNIVGGAVSKVSHVVICAILLMKWKWRSDCYFQLLIFAKVNSIKAWMKKQIEAYKLSFYIFSFTESYQKSFHENAFKSDMFCWCLQNDSPNYSSRY